MAERKKNSANPAERQLTMRIVHLIIGLGDGGAERSLYKLVTADGSNEHIVISLTSQGKYGPLLSDRGVIVVSVGSSFRAAIPSFLALGRSLRVMKPEILHGWMPHGALVASLVKNLAGAKRVLWSIRASDYGGGIRTFPTRAIVKILARLSHTSPDKILVVGRKALDAHAKIGFDSNKMIWIPNGYELSSAKITDRGETKSATLITNPAIVVLGMVARLHPQKNHVGLLQVLSQVKRRHSGWVLRLVGEGLSEDNHELVRLVSRLGLSDHVELLGAHQNPEEIYNTFDVHILPSMYGEGFPNVVAESMLAGVPNIVTDVGDSAEIVGDTGWIVQPQAADELAAAIQDALNCEPLELRGRGLRAKERIVQSYSIEKMVQSHVREYERRRLVVYPRYSRLGASSRVRMFQYEEILAKSGWELSFYPFSSDSFLQNRYAGRKAWASVVASYWRRVISLRKIATADLVWVEKEFIPWAPSWIEKALIPDRGKTVYDFDDAVHEQFRYNRHAAVRVALGSKISNTVSKSSAVLAGNSTLKDYFSSQLGVASLLIPSSIDTKRLSPAEETPTEETRPFVFGWIGTPVTYEAYLEPLLPMFELIAGTLGAEFWVIGVDEPSDFSGSVQFFPWSLEEEARLLRKIDVGIMPLRDDPWSKGKCGYKLLQYMAAGKAVIASPVGVNNEIVSHGKTGYLAQDESDWERYLSELAKDRNFSAAMGKKGRATVASNYSLENAGRQLVDFFDQLLSN